MSCDRYWELLSARLDGALTEDGERELEEHLAACPACRAEQSRLAAIQAAFDELEEIEAPEGFAQGVMDRVRAAEAEKKVVPLFRRPRFRALAGLAACAALAIGLYGAAYLQQKSADEEHFNLTVRSFNQDALILDTDSDEEEQPPQITAYAASEEDGEIPSLYDSLKMANGAETEPRYSMERGAELVLTLECLPEGAKELILNSEAASAVEVGQDGAVCFHCVTLEELEQVERMAQEQDIAASRGLGAEESGRYVIIVLDGLE